MKDARLNNSKKRIRKKAFQHIKQNRLISSALLLLTLIGCGGVEEKDTKKRKAANAPTEKSAFPGRPVTAADQKTSDAGLGNSESSNFYSRSIGGGASNDASNTAKTAQTKESEAERAKQASNDRMWNLFETMLPMMMMHDMFFAKNGEKWLSLGNSSQASSKKEVDKPSETPKVDAKQGTKQGDGVDTGQRAKSSPSTTAKEKGNNLSNTVPLPLAKPQQGIRTPQLIVSPADGVKNPDKIEVADGCTVTTDIWTKNIDSVTRFLGAQI